MIQTLIGMGLLTIALKITLHSEDIMIKIMSKQQRADTRTKIINNITEGYAVILGDLEILSQEWKMFLNGLTLVSISTIRESCHKMSAPIANIKSHSQP